MSSIYDEKSDEEILRKLVENIENKRMNPAFWAKPKKTRTIYDIPRKYLLTKAEKDTLPKKYEEYLFIQRKAIDVVRKYIKEFCDNPEYVVTIEDLKRGLNVLEVGLHKDIENGIEGFLAVLERFPKGRRPGFGLSRGFEEFLLGMPKEDKYWVNEIFDAVDAIEDYYRSM